MNPAVLTDLSRARIGATRIAYKNFLPLDIAEYIYAVVRAPIDAAVLTIQRLARRQINRRRAYTRLGMTFYGRPFYIYNYTMAEFLPGGLFGST